MPKPSLVLIPGTLCDARMFARQARALRLQARVHCVTYRHLDWQGDWAAQILKKLPERFALAGFSLGGLVALELLRRAPERIERLALIASNAEPAGSTAQRRSTLLHRLWLASGPGAVSRQSKPAYFHHAARRQQHAGLLFDMALQTPRRAALGEFAWAATRPSGYDALAAFQGPVLIASGAQDRLCPPALQQRMAAAQPKAHWCEIRRCGHFVPLEAPGRLNDVLRFWLNEPVYPRLRDHIESTVKSHPTYQSAC